METIDVFLTGLTKLSQCSLSEILASKPRKAVYIRKLHFLIASAELFI